MPTIPDTPLALTTLSEDEQLLRDSVREFAEAEVRPLVRDMDDRQAIPRTLIDRLFALGVMGVEVPEDLGGAGGRLFQTVLVVEALSRVDPAVGVLVDVQNTLVVNALSRWGSQALQRRYLPQLASRAVGAYALSEAGSGSDAFALTTRGEDRGGAFALTGRKLWITNAAEADIFIVFANVNPDAGYRGITAFVLERGTPGFTVGRKEDKLGIRASSTCELLLDDCVVPTDQILGEVGKGYKVAIETLNEGRNRYRRPDDRTGRRRARPCPWRTRRHVNSSAGRSPSSRACNSSSRTGHGARGRAPHRVQRGAAARHGPPVPDRSRDVCKLFSSDMAERVSSLAVQLFGGYGYVKDYPVEKLYRDAKVGQIYEGTSNLQLQTIAKQILGKG